MATLINNDIFNKKISLHFDHTTCAKVYESIYSYLGTK
jgi:hypothetical protein